MVVSAKVVSVIVISEGNKMLKSAILEGITVSTADQQRTNWKALLLIVRGLTKVLEALGRKFPGSKKIKQNNLPKVIRCLG